MKRYTIWFLLLPILLSSCQPGALSFSPEQAAIQVVQSRKTNRSTISPNTFQVPQTRDQEGKTFVLLSYQQITEGRLENCLEFVETEKNRAGFWRALSSGGGCSGRIGGGPSTELEMPLEIGGGRSSGNTQTDLGESYVYGLVFQEDIQRMKVTWEDSENQETDVVNGSFLVIRSGQLDFLTVEGLNESGEVVSTFTTAAAPGKK